MGRACESDNDSHYLFTRAASYGTHWAAEASNSSAAANGLKEPKGPKMHQIVENLAGYTRRKFYSKLSSPLCRGKSRIMEDLVSSEIENVPKFWST
jgi:hypothetical protein